MRPILGLPWEDQDLVSTHKMEYYLFKRLAPYRAGEKFTFRRLKGHKVQF